MNDEPQKRSTMWLLMFHWGRLILKTLLSPTRRRKIISSLAEKTASSLEPSLLSESTLTSTRRMHQIQDQMKRLSTVHRLAERRLRQLEEESSRLKNGSPWHSLGKEWARSRSSPLRKDGTSLD